MQATIGISPTEVLASTAVPQFKLGTHAVAETADGTKEYLYVHASEIITAAGYLCLVSSGYEAQMVDTTSSAPGVGAGLRVGAALAAVEPHPRDPPNRRPAGVRAGAGHHGGAGRCGGHHLGFCARR